MKIIFKIQIEDPYYYNNAETLGSTAQTIFVNTVNRPELSFDFMVKRNLIEFSVVELSHEEYSRCMDSVYAALMLSQVKLSFSPEVINP